MNVNVWGPPVWQFLHGLSALTNQKNFSHWRNILETLEFLLPCSLCLNSYREFLRKDLEIPFVFISDKKCMEFLFALHNKVNEKLDKQKRRESNNPTFDVILKRAALTENKPFGEELLWRILLIFSFPLLNEEEENSAVFIKFVSNLSSFLLHTENYQSFSKKLHRLIILLETQQMMSSFSLTICARDELYNYEAQVQKHIAKIFQLYALNLPAKSCVNSCI